MTCRLRHQRGEHGFTLIELMLALFIFMVGLAGITAFQIASMGAVQRSGDISIATNLAASTLEELRVTSYDHVVGTSSAFYDRYGAAVADGGYFTVTWVAVQLGVGQTDVEATTSWVHRLTVADVPVGSEYQHKVTMRARLFLRPEI